MAQTAVALVLRRRPARPRRRGAALPAARRRPARTRWWLVRLAAVAGLGLLLAVGAGIVYQVVRKPGELLALVASPEPLAPQETWRRYQGAFRAHATELVRPAFLAALAQAESQGDPFARTPWRWRWTWNPFALYAPTSSAIGLYQLTDAAFVEARELCVREGRVVRGGPWYDPRGCWLSGLYTRVVPGHAVEMTAAWLHHHLVQILGPAGARRVSRAERERLAAAIHLCGPTRGAAFARRGFRVWPGERCGAHDVGRYLRRVESLTRTFARLGAP